MGWKSQFLQDKLVNNHPGRSGNRGASFLSFTNAKIEEKSKAERWRLASNLPTLQLLSAVAWQRVPLVVEQRDGSWGGLL